MRSGLGLLAGAATFVPVDSALDCYVTGHAGPEQREVTKAGARGGVGFALLAAVTLDGVPENLALGVSLASGVSLTLLVAIFFSNLPESLVGAVALCESGQSKRTVIMTWATCALLLADAVVLGRVVAGGLSDAVLAVALSFAGGAVTASLADTLMPEAFEHGRPLNAFATAGGLPVVHPCCMNSPGKRLGRMRTSNDRSGPREGRWIAIVDSPHARRLQLSYTPLHWAPNNELQHSTH